MLSTRVYLNNKRSQHPSPHFNNSQFSRSIIFRSNRREKQLFSRLMYAKDDWILLFSL